MKLYIPAQPELPALIACLSLPRCRECWLDLAPVINRDQRVENQVSEILPSDRVGARAGCRIQSGGGGPRGNSQGAASPGTSVAASPWGKHEATEPKSLPGGIVPSFPFVD